MSEGAVDRRTFLASAGLVTALAAAREEHGISEAEVLRLQPGDVIVLTCPESLSMDELCGLRASLGAAIPDGVKVVVLCAGLTLQVVRPEP